MSLKVLIADDEKEARALIHHFLREMHPSALVTEAANGNDSLSYLEEEKFDLLFLDIKMPGISGLEILKKLTGEKPAIILTTAFEKHAITAFDHDAVDYLLKPFDKTRFEKALIKAVGYLELKKIKNRNNYLTHIPIKTGTKTSLIPLTEIEFFQAKADYISIITSTSVFLIRTTLAELENTLDPKKFIRVHKSTIINSELIKKIESLPSGDLTIVTRGDKLIRASRNYKERLKPLLNTR